MAFLTPEPEPSLAGVAVGQHAAGAIGLAGVPAAPQLVVSLDPEAHEGVVIRTGGDRPRRHARGGSRRRRRRWARMPQADSSPREEAAEASTVVSLEQLIVTILAVYADDPVTLVAGAQHPIRW